MTEKTEYRYHSHCSQRFDLSPPPLRYQGCEGWAPASYLKKTDIQGQKPLAGAAAHASANDLDGFSKQNQQNNAAKENRENSQKENRLSFFSEKSRE